MMNFSLHFNVIYEWLIHCKKKKKERLKERLLICTVCGFCFFKQYFQVGLHNNIPYSLTGLKTEKYPHTLQSRRYTVLAKVPPGAGLGFFFAPGKGQIRGFNIFHVTWSAAMLDLTFQGIKKVKEGPLFRDFWNTEYLKVKKTEMKPVFTMHLLLCLALW